MEDSTAGAIERSRTGADSDDGSLMHLKSEDIGNKFALLWSALCSINDALIGFTFSELIDFVKRIVDNSENAIDKKGLTERIITNMLNHGVISQDYLMDKFCKERADCDSLALTSVYTTLDAQNASLKRELDNTRDRLNKALCKNIKFEKDLSRIYAMFKKCKYEADIENDKNLAKHC